MERLQCGVCRLNYVNSKEMAYGILGLECSMSSVVQAQKVVQGYDVGLDVYRRLIWGKTEFYIVV